ncbi:MAG: DMT family transporter [Cohaesibacteraceae bacterium]|nr:DMT family transporter [Cohaesibacteraceae bacterium]
MNNIVLFGIVGALLAGLAMVLQGILATRTGNDIGPIVTGSLIYFAGGLIAIVGLSIYWIGGSNSLPVLSSAVIINVILAGVMGLVIVGGVAFSFARIGAGAAIAITILVQMTIGALADHYGWMGQPPQAITLERVAGLILLFFATWLLVPKNN